MRRNQWRRWRRLGGVAVVVTFGCDECQLILSKPGVEETSNATSDSSGTEVVELSSSGADESSSSGGDESSSSESSGVTEVATTGAVDLCGNGDVDVGEACDDGNKIDEDGCPSGEIGQCQMYAHCGDGIVMSPGEECDDGNQVDEDECPSGLKGNCKLPSCGDGIVYGAEVCDDGNHSDEDACPDDQGGCVAPAFCGDEFIWAGVEECDDGNAAPFDSCDACVANRYAFVSSTSMLGNFALNMLPDSRCTFLADDAGLEGKYKAWIDFGESPMVWFDDPDFSGMYVTLCETPILREDDHPWNALGAIDCDEYKQDVPIAWVWSNVATDGSQVSLVDDCGGWVSEDGGLFGGVGSALSADKGWTDAGAITCNSEARLYCFQVGD